MKALVIAESVEVLNQFTEYLQKAGYDTISYRWIIKALDNVEEINPHLIIISAIDYPRHWKTLVQYVHANVSNNNPTIVLFGDSNMDDEEKEKAKFLGIHASVNKPEDISTIISNNKSEIHQTNIVEITNINEQDKQIDTVDSILKNSTTISNSENDLSTNFTENTSLDDEIVENKKTDWTPFSAIGKEESAATEITIIDNEATAESHEPASINNESANESNEPASINNESTNERNEPASISNESANESNEPASTDTAIIDNGTTTESHEPHLTHEVLTNDEMPIDDEISTDKELKFMFTNPITHAIVTGKVVEYKYPTLQFLPDNKESVKNLRFGQIFGDCTLKINGSIESHRAQIQGVSETIEFCLLK